MLDTETKRRVDTARNILVGKVPDPKSQVEQITIALIYKFMDDMDAQSVEMGGKASFFTGEFEKYGWRRVFDPRLGGFDILALYSEAITKINENANVPQLFRDIFKNAYLPYRDPETLKLFLKTIDEFRYDHSERLGDAFEYLLSVLGSQGDAGQFRTPRHIIDFVVDIVDPQKGETILDPASGTAGFLISAYKHIVEHNPNMTPDERKRLMTNVVGYDISPDMVRLGLANMYLHGFPTPEIHEYDTLTSEDRWNEYYDVILANPPFMSPKGGIQPHKKFAISAKRSEVLFVDYIAEHLTTKGRAGIIVPEGIIFQSQTAYKALRKMLVEQCLVAVVSLPAGVFNPYSGVKTSILILDRQLAKQSDSVGFFKVENDGFNLGAQRRPIEQNDLPQVFADINEYFDKLRTGQPTDELELQTGIIVPKEKLAANGDYNLSGERYREGATRSSSFPIVPLGEVCTINPAKSEGLSLPPETVISFVPMSDLGENRMTFMPRETKRIDEIGTSYTYFADGDVLIAKVTPCFENGKAGIASNLSNGVGFGSSEFYVLRPSDRVLAEFVYFCVTHQQFRQPAIEQMTGTGGLQRVPKSYVEQFEIPLPPLEVQREIVAEIEGYQKVIDGARAVIDNYRPRIPINPTWPMVELRDVGKVCMCKRIFKQQTSDKGDIPFYKIGTFGGEPDAFISQELFNEYRRKYVYPKTGDILISTSGTIGRTVVFDGKPAYFQDSNIVWIANDETLVTNRFLRLSFESIEWQPTIGVTVARLYNKLIEETKIPLPPLEEQERIVAEIEAERRLVEANRELIERMEAKIAAVLDRIWGTPDQKTEQRPETEASAANRQ